MLTKDMSNKDFISIGILCSEKNNITYKLLKKIFVKSGYKLVYNNCINIYSYKEKTVLIMELTPETIKGSCDLNLYFDIIVQASFIEDYDNPLIKKTIIKSKHIILNIDDENSTKILDEDIKGLIITYGINKKATITASSLNSINKIEFNVCLQRECESIYGKQIEPKEVPIILDSIKGLNIYHGLSTIACGLSYGMSIENMRDVLL